MANLTTYAYKQLIETIDYNKIELYITKDFFVNNIYDDERLYNFFNQFELKKLYMFRNLLESSEEKEVFKFVEEKEDTKQTVFVKGGKLKYHLFSDCLSLKQAFIDFRIPDDIEDNLIEVYRGWFKTMKFKENFASKKIKDNDIRRDYNNLFAKTHNLNKRPVEYKFVLEYGNSDTKFLENSFNYDKYLTKLEDALERKQLISNGKTLGFLFKHDYLRNKTDIEITNKIRFFSIQNEEIIHPLFLENYGIENLKKFLNKSFELKSELRLLLEDYIKWTYNFRDKEFNVITLEHFGLQCCRVCEKESKSEVII